MKGKQKYDFIIEMRQQGFNNIQIAKELGMSNAKSVSVWLSRNKQYATGNIIIPKHKNRTKTKNPPKKKMKRVEVPAFNQLYQYMKEHPNHVHYQYFMRETKGKTQMEVNQAMIVKVLDLMREMI